MTKDNIKGHSHNHYHSATKGEARSLKIALILFAVVSLVARFCPLDYWLKLALYVSLYLFVGYEVLLNAVKGVLHGEWFDENFLMTVATLGVFALELYDGHDEFSEAVAVILLFRIGEFFLGYASRRSLATAQRQGLSINKESNSEAFITRFAKVYTPFICVIAIILALLIPIIYICAGWEACWDVWLYRALTFLVISCPCALVISIPLTFFAAIMGASRQGIIITDGCCLETLHKGTFPEGDIVFTDDKTDKMETAKRIAHKCMHIVWQNICLAVGIKIICLILSAFGYAPMWLAVFADTGMMIICVLNALRAIK